MKKLILSLLIVFVQHSWAQTTRIDTSKSIRDTTLLVAKEYCPDNPTTCGFGDNILLNRMLVYDGHSFWKNYPSMLFYFTGLDLRNYQEKNNIDYSYLQQVEDLLNEDLKNDSNRIVVVKKRKGRIDTVQYKLYKIRFSYVYVKKTNEFIPNFFDPKVFASYIYYPSSIYYITKIERIGPYNELRTKNKIIKVN